MKKIVIVSMLALGISTTAPAPSLQAHVGDRFLEFCKGVSDDCWNLAIDFVKRPVTCVFKNPVKTVVAALLIGMYLTAPDHNIMKHLFVDNSYVGGLGSHVGDLMKNQYVSKVAETSIFVGKGLCGFSARQLASMESYLNGLLPVNGTA